MFWTKILMYRAFNLDVSDANIHELAAVTFPAVAILIPRLALWSVIGLKKQTTMAKRQVRL